MRSEWINIKKKHPKNMSGYGACSRTNAKENLFYSLTHSCGGGIEKGFGHWTRADCTPLESGYVVTHWHPLPPAPEEMRK